MDGQHPQGQEGPDRRTTLAADRTVFAAERTYAAWVRTGLAALASGVGARKLLEGFVPEWVILLGGTVLVLLSAFSFGAGVWRQVLHPGSLPPEGDTKRIYPPVLIGVNAALIVVAFSALVGVWAGRPGPD
jgi:putative membrane protein